MNHPHVAGGHRRPIRGHLRRLPALALVFTLVLVAGGCGNDKTTQEKVSDALNRGLAELAAGQYEKATADFNKVLELKPTNKFGHYNLGVVEQQNNRLVTAEQYYRATLALDPNLESALFNLAIIRTAINPQEAETLYRHCIEVNANSAGCHLNLGFLLKDVLDNEKEGVEEIKIAARLNPAFENRVPKETSTTTGGSGSKSSRSTTTTVDDTSPTTTTEP